MSRRLSILIYHRVLQRPDPLQPSLPDAARFKRHMRWLRRCFNVLPLGEAVRRLRDGTLPPRAAAITFDDGYADNHDVALPILQGLGLHATFFVASGFLDGGRMWNDTVIETVRRWREPVLSFEPLGLERLRVGTDTERRATIDHLLTALKHRDFEERARLVEDLGARLGEDLGSPMMTSHQLRGLHRAGMTIGAHTRSHPILRVVSDERARDEIQLGRGDLEAMLGESVDLFAFPNGRPGHDFDERHVRMVEELGFAGAVTTEWNAAGVHTDPFRLPRFTPWDRFTPAFVARLLLYRRSGITSPAEA